MSKLRLSLLLAGSVLVGGGGSAAAATVSQADEAPAAGRSARTPGMIEEVVVTAEKTATNLQDTPAAVTAVSGEALVSAGITSPLGLSSVVPGITFRTRGPVTQMFIRGVGSNVDSPQVLPSVATQMNQIYVPREATGGSFYDLASVEVLPGPQGTLYGRDAAGGTVNIMFNRPSGEDETSALLEIGDYSLIHFTGVKNIPLNDKFMLRAAVDVNQHDGYLTNGSNDLESRSVRLGALALPTDNLTVYAWASYWRNGGKGPEVVSNPHIRPSDPWYMPPSVPAGISKFESTMAGAQIDWDIGDVTLTYIPGYSRFVEDSFASFASPAVYLNAPGAAFTLHIDQNWTNLTQELRVSGQSRSLRWLAALYWYSQETSYDRNQIGQLSGAVSTVITIPEQINSGHAIYGQATYSPRDWLHLTAGARASSDGVEVSGINTGARVPFRFNKDWRHVDWKLGVKADLNDDSNVYATLQTGFLRGGYSPGAISRSGVLVGTTAVDPVELMSYVVGSKNRFLGGRLQLNGEAFYYDYQNYQVSAIDLTTNISSFLNAKKAEIYGLQLDMTVLVTADDRVTLSTSLSRSEAVDFRLPGVGDFSGFTLTNSPEVTINGSWEHTWRLASEARLVLRADTRYASESYLLYSHANGSRQAPYTTSNASLTYYASNSTWDVGVWVRNIENVAIFGAGATVGPIGAVYLGDPRTAGVRLNAKF
jgi:iron complex outermembrane recepter protein